MIELPIVETRQVVTNLDVGETRAAPDVRARTDGIRRIEARRQNANQIGPVGRWGWMTPVDVRPAGRTEVPNPVVG